MAVDITTSKQKVNVLVAYWMFKTVYKQSQSLQTQSGLG